MRPAEGWEDVEREELGMEQHDQRLRIGVLGACGGAGGSSFAAALAREIAGRRDGPSTLIDLDAGGGLDVVLGIEELPGLRWADLHAARGDVPGTELLDLMPRWGEVLVLSADRARAEPIAPDVVHGVVRSIADVSDIVLDLGRCDLALATMCDRVLLVVPRDLRGIAGAQVALSELSRCATPLDNVALVVRGPAPGGLDPVQVARVLGRPVAASMSAEPALAVAIERGAGPGGRRLQRGAQRVLDYVSAGRRTARSVDGALEARRGPERIPVGPLA